MDLKRILGRPLVARALLSQHLCSRGVRSGAFLWSSILAAWIGGPRLSASPQVLAEQKISGLTGGFSGFLGHVVSELGDLDNDGVSDVIVGCPADNDGGSLKGSASILFLKSDGTVRQQQKIAGSTGVTGIDDGDQFGIFPVGLGDLDGDGVEDVAIGALLDDDGGPDRGAVYILFLNSDGTIKSQNKISATSGGFAGPLANSVYFGSSLARMNDFDGDSNPELAVGAYGDDTGGSDQGALWILFLDSAGMVKSTPPPKKIAEGVGGFGGTLDPNDYFGIAVTSTQDFDNDGIEELAVGASADDDGGSPTCNRGATWILFMNSSGTVKSSLKISDTSGGFTGPLHDGDQFGRYLARIGDLDCDGLEELAVGAYLTDLPLVGGADRGAIWILFMNPNGTVRRAELVGHGTGGFGGSLNNADYFGSGLSRVADLNGDGLDEFAVGAYGDDDGGTDRGAVWICFSDCQATASVSSRNSGANPMSYTATPAILGSTVTATVDLTTTGHSFARLMQSDRRIQRTLFGGQVLLVGGRGALKATLASGVLPGTPGPIATFQIPIPNDTALCGRHIYTQAVHYGGVSPFALSNSQDLVLGR